MFGREVAMNLIMEVIGIRTPHLERIRLGGALRGSPSTHVGVKSHDAVSKLDIYICTITNCISSYRDVTRIIKIILKIV